MIESLSVLKKISKEQGIDTITSDAIDTVSILLDEGLEEIITFLDKSVETAPDPVTQISSYILDAGGKRIRPSLCLLCAKAFSDTATPVELAVVCELLHNATLLHDDVIDEGDMRRGKPAARMVWSNALSILGGDYMLMRCVEIISSMPSIYMNQFVSTLKSLVEGEIVQLRLRESVATSNEDYFRIVDGKTSSLFGFASFAGAAAGEASSSDIKKMETFGRNIGVSFQLIDDVLDYSSDAGVLGKNLLADISQGKMTLPVIIAAEKNEKVVDALCRLQRGDDVAACAEEIAVAVKRSGALDIAREEAAKYTDLAVAALETVSASNAAVIAVLKQLALSLLHRGN
ncbi:MAG: polyprenyl synthetase family protein [Deltaproteobacteria bacterium]|nr:polyprenyl synthetase family protein [Deltaproteobacteria bacterium]